MAKKVYEEEKIRAIAEKIREHTGEETSYTTDEMPSGVDDVHEAGYNKGYNKGVEDATTLPTLFGSYTLPEVIEARNIVETTLDVTDCGVMAYFYYEGEYHYNEVKEIRFGWNFSFDLLCDEYPPISYTQTGGWAVIGGTFSGESHRVVTFTQPLEVPQMVYDNWLSICKQAEETPYEVGYNEGSGIYAPTVYNLSSVDELPSDAVDGSLALVTGGSEMVGTWLLNKEIDVESLSFDCPVKFIFAGNQEASRLIVGEYAAPHDTPEIGMAYVANNGIEHPAYATIHEIGWVNGEGDRIITVLEDVDPSEFTIWLSGNAIRINDYVLYSRENGEWVHKGII